MAKNTIAMWKLKYIYRNFLGVKILFYIDNLEISFKLLSYFKIKNRDLNLGLLDSLIF